MVEGGFEPFPANFVIFFYRGGGDELAVGVIADEAAFVGEQEELSAYHALFAVLGLIDVDDALVGFDGVGNGGERVAVAFGEAGGEIVAHLQDVERIGFQFNAAGAGGRIDGAGEWA